MLCHNDITLVWKRDYCLLLLFLCILTKLSCSQQYVPNNNVETNNNDLSENNKQQSKINAILNQIEMRKKQVNNALNNVQDPRQQANNIVVDENKNVNNLADGGVPNIPIKQDSFQPEKNNLDSVNWHDENFKQKLKVKFVNPSSVLKNNADHLNQQAPFDESLQNQSIKSKKRKSKKKKHTNDNNTLKFNEIPRNADDMNNAGAFDKLGSQLGGANVGINRAKDAMFLNSNKALQDKNLQVGLNNAGNMELPPHGAHGNPVVAPQIAGDLLNQNTGVKYGIADNVNNAETEVKKNQLPVIENGGGGGIYVGNTGVNQMVQVLDNGNGMVMNQNKQLTTISQFADKNENAKHSFDEHANDIIEKSIRNDAVAETFNNDAVAESFKNEDQNDPASRQDTGFDKNRASNVLSDDFNQLNENYLRQRREREEEEQRQKKKKDTRHIPKGSPRPPVSQKKDVVWFEEYHSFSLRASIDNRFRIRHAPIPAYGSPWPLPQFYKPEYQQFIVKPENFKFYAAGETCDILEYQFERLKKNLFGPEEPNISQSEGHQGTYFNIFRDSDDPLPEIKHLNVTVLKECGRIPQLDMDESYDLEIRKSGAVIISREVWGAIRGLETFGQLVYQDDHDRFLVNKTLIHDFPRFKHRGMLLDTSRHYLNKETIILNLEALAQNKMNVFHWHIVDEQSFPFDCHTFPNLTKMGAYSSSHTYTHQDIRQIIDEARLRGIRVVPEFDTPGHTLAWGYGVDNLLTPCYDYNGSPDGYYGPINPILKSSYRFLEGLLKEVLDLWEDKYVHLGGDEVPLDCWQSNPFIQRFMNRNKLYDIKDLLNIYEKKLIDIVTNIGKNRKIGSGYTVWQEVFDDGVELKPDTVVQVWKGDAWDIDRVTSKGYRALFSSCWYLDYINYGQDWDKYYRCDQVGPHLEMYNVRNESLLIGGEVCLWTEYADDENILQRIWPRASAAAERLWSHKDVLDTQAAAPRIEAQRCRMKSRGIPVGVLSGPGYCEKHSKKSQPPSLLEWIKPLISDNGSAKNIYVVDMNAMYVVPLVIVVCLVFVVVLASLQQNHSQKKLFAILALPTGSRHGVKSLVYVFMLFTLLWCIWTAPIWLHSWENTNNIKK